MIGHRCLKSYLFRQLVVCIAQHIAGFRCNLASAVVQLQYPGNSIRCAVCRADQSRANVVHVFNLELAVLVVCLGIRQGRHIVLTHNIERNVLRERLACGNSIAISASLYHRKTVNVVLFVDSNAHVIPVKSNMEAAKIG